jgi:hypothetical protein
MILTLFVGQSQAQSVLGNSPISRFGLGDLIPEQNVRSLGMGMTGIANPDPDFVNLMNPALLTFHKMVNLEVGLSYIAKDLSDVNTTYKSRGGGISYLSFTFPLTNRLVSNLSIMPLSSVDYSVRFSEKNYFGDGRNFNKVLSGSGGLNKVNFNLGYNITRRWSIGLAPSLIFGNINNDVTYGVITPNASGEPFVITNNNYNIFDATGRAGFNYRVPLDTLDKHFLSIGGFAELGRNLNGNLLGRIEYLPSSFTTAFRLTDTIASGSVKATYPAAFGIGISYSKLLSYTLTADMQYRLFEGSTFGEQRAPYRNSFMVGVGGEWTPNAYSKNYLGICTYRGGLNYTQQPLVLGGSQLNDYSVSLGITAPMVRKEAKFTRPYISTALVIGQRGSVATNGISEYYIKACLGITLNDATWFKRYKHD